MRKYLVLLLTIIHFGIVEGQVDHPLLKQADSLYNLMEFRESSAKYEALFKAAPKSNDAKTLYKAAVAFSKIRNSNKAVACLQESIDKGMDDVYLSDIRFDLNFHSIRHTQDWKQFLDHNLSIFDKEAQKIEHPGLRAEILDLWRSDQYYRILIFGRFNGRPPNEVGRATEAVDRFNAMRIEQIMEEIDGWPTHSKVGRDGAHAAWNIIQHAVFNPPLMKKCLAHMEVALAKNEVDGVDYAYLYDRFNAVCSLGKQDYGIVRRVPIREEHLVEERRKAVGFKQTLIEYLGAYTPKTKVEYEKMELELQDRYLTNLEKGKGELEQGNYEEAAKFYSKIMSCNGYIQMEDIYNSAKIKSMLNTPRSKFQAIRYIRSLSARGFNDLKRLENDPAFDNIRTEKGYLEVLAIIKKYNTPQNKN